MRKWQITSTLQSTRPSDQAWLDSDHAALVEVTSEEDGYPIESALIGVDKRGWRAADNPANLRSTAKAQTYLASFRGEQKETHARIRSANVPRPRKVFPGNRPPAVEFQPS